MDASIINPFLVSTINLFKEMFGIKIENGNPYIAKSNGNHRWDVSGVIGVVGETEGVIVIRFTRTLAFKLLIESGLDDKSMTNTDELIRGMVGEFANIISGNAINSMKNKKVDITVPITIQGENHTISWPAKAPIISVPFTSPYGPFEVQISLT
ncbi:MAG: chemotaxis protein CheX [Spirochaetales bacterium]|nr:chemotaxis protein CheX [Spirochaetales bacterium]